MKRFFVCVVFITIILSLSSCGNKNNPVTQENNSAWSKVAQINNVSYPKIYFLNKNVGFVTANVFLASTIHLQTKILKQFSTNDTVYKIAEYSILNTDLDPTAHPLWKTTDGGHSWKPITGDFKSSIRDIYFVDEQTGFLVTDYEGVFKTLDGGETWSQIFSSYIEIFITDKGMGSFAYPKEVCFYDKDHGFIYTEGSLQNLYLFTNDGGYNWDFKYVPLRGENYIFPEKGKKIGYAEKNSVMLAKTMDGGLTWNKIAELSTANDVFSFVDDNNGVYLKNKQLFCTTDGGITFTNIHDFGSDYQWECRTANILYNYTNGCYFVIGDKIGLSVDGCKTITDMSAPKTAYMDIAFPNEKIGYAINSEGEIFKYNTGVK